MGKESTENKWQCTDGIGSHHAHVQEREGVYVIIHIDAIAKKQSVIYVGRSLNLKSRWKSHNIYNRAFKDGFSCYVKWKWCSNSAELEKRLIKRFKPIYNKQFNEGISIR